MRDVVVVKGKNEIDITATFTGSELVLVSVLVDTFIPDYERDLEYYKGVSKEELLENDIDPDIVSAIQEELKLLYGLSSKFRETFDFAGIKKV